jgi:hypothetical protein
VPYAWSLSKDVRDTGQPSVRSSARFEFVFSAIVAISFTSKAPAVNWKGAFKELLVSFMPHLDRRNRQMGPTC